MENLRKFIQCRSPPIIDKILTHNMDDVRYWLVVLPKEKDGAQNLQHFTEQRYSDFALD